MPHRVTAFWQLCMPIAWEYIGHWKCNPWHSSILLSGCLIRNCTIAALFWLKGTTAELCGLEEASEVAQNLTLGRVCNTELGLHRHASSHEPSTPSPPAWAPSRCWSQGFSVPQARKLPAHLLCGGPKIQRDCVSAQAPLSVCRIKCGSASSSLEGAPCMKYWQSCWPTGAMLATVQSVLRTPIFQQRSASKRRLLSAHSEQKGFWEGHETLHSFPRSFRLRRAWLIPSWAGVCLSPSGCHGKTESSPFLGLLWDWGQPLSLC